MSLFEAEIRGRIGLLEDSLTAKAFGVLDIVDRKQMLKPFLTNIGIELTDDDVQNLQIKLWEWQGKTEPDVIIEGSGKLIYVEAKLGSPLGEEQVLNEYRDGFGKNKDFHLVAITRDPLQPQCIDEARDVLSQEFDEVNIHWARWHDLHSLLKKGCENLSENAERKIVNELINLFESQGLRAFDGFGEEVQKISLAQFLTFFEDLSLFANEIASRSGLQIGRYIVRGSQSGVVDWYKNWFSSWIAFSFWDEGWVKDTHNQISFHVDLSSEIPEISLGYELSFGDGWAINKHILREKSTEIDKKIAAMNGLKVAFEDQEYLMDSFDQDAFQEQLKHTQGSISFYFDIEISELRSKDILENVLEKIDRLRNFVNDLRLFATSEEKDEFNKIKEQEKQEELPET